METIICKQCLKETEGAEGINWLQNKLFKNQQVALVVLL